MGLSCKLRLYSHFILISSNKLVLLELGTGRNACRPFLLKALDYQNLPKLTKTYPTGTLPTRSLWVFIYFIITIYSDYVSVFSFKTTLIVVKSRGYYFDSSWIYQYNPKKKDLHLDVRNTMMNILCFWPHLSRHILLKPYLKLGSKG
jgi:hypothetical protein